MYVLLNGAFGVGKSSVARELQRRLSHSAIFDPEWVGLVLMRLPGYAASDFQHLASWRRLSVLGARCFRLVRRTVIIPMAFSERSVLEEVRSALTSHGQTVMHFCLTAPLEIVQERLRSRGEPVEDPQWAWVHRRAAECCDAHRSSDFGVHVPTEHREPSAVAAAIAERIATAARR